MDEERFSALAARYSSESEAISFMWEVFQEKCREVDTLEYQCGLYLKIIHWLVFILGSVLASGFFALLVLLRRIFP